MGQFALGLRSLLVRAAIFVIMAALLAWALGGTLWPKPARVDLPGVHVGGSTWFWRVTESTGKFPAGKGLWQIMRSNADGQSVAAFDDLHWDEVAGPVARDGMVYFGGRPTTFDASNESRWLIIEIDPQRDKKEQIVSQRQAPSRFAVDAQLARISAGLPLQSAEIIAQQHAPGLDPRGNSADE